MRGGEEGKEEKETRKGEARGRKGGESQEDRE